ncbi:MAG: hypothetical protein ABR535_05675 [Pyrinomonadaceae bacterium]
MTYEFFAGQVNTKFSLPDAAAELELIEVTNPTVTMSQTFFSLFFLGRGEPVLPQATYRMEHEQLSSLEIFLVPVSREADGFRYEAVFNFLNEA